MKKERCLSRDLGTSCWLGDELLAWDELVAWGRAIGLGTSYCSISSNNAADCSPDLRKLGEMVLQIE